MNNINHFFINTILLIKNIIFFFFYNFLVDSGSLILISLTMFSPWLLLKSRFLYKNKI